MSLFGVEVRKAKIVNLSVGATRSRSKSAIVYPNETKTKTRWTTRDSAAPRNIRTLWPEPAPLQWLSLTLTLKSSISRMKKKNFPKLPLRNQRLNLEGEMNALFDRASQRRNSRMRRRRRRRGRLEAARELRKILRLRAWSLR